MRGRRPRPLDECAPESAQCSRIEEAGGTSRDQVRRVATVVVGAWNASPDLIRLLVREVARGPRLEQEIQEIRLAFQACRRKT